MLNFFYMEKFRHKIHEELLKNIPFSYFSTAIYADFSAYVFERNGESLVVWQDTLYPHDFPCLFPPKQKKNWERCSISFAEGAFVESIKKAQIEIIAQVPAGNEFFYKTNTFVHPTGEMDRDVKLFKRRYPEFRIANTCDPKIVQDFYEKWKKQKSRENIVFNRAQDFFVFCLDRLKQYKIRQVYVFIDDHLVGLAWGVMHSPGKWVGLHLKSLYTYKGLGRFLHHERAKLFSHVPQLTLGTEAFEKGIAQFKEGLGPMKHSAYYYVLTGDSKKKKR